MWPLFLPKLVVKTLIYRLLISNFVIMVYKDKFSNNGKEGVPIMEMERINEDTIRVVVTNDDLAERSISVIDLLGNQEEIERFFYNILEEVDVEHDFENNGLSLSKYCQTEMAWSCLFQRTLAIRP